MRGGVPARGGKEKEEGKLNPLQMQSAVDAAVNNQFASRPAPEFVSPLNADNTLGSAFNVNAPAALGTNFGFNALDTKALAADPRALDAMRERALGGDSPWLKLQLEKQGLGQQDAMDQAAKIAMSSSAAARTSAGMRGGLSAGASERMAKRAASDLNMARQGVVRQGLGDRLNLGIADDQTKMALLGQTAGLDLQHSGQAIDMGKFNASGALEADKMSLDAQKFNSAQQFDADKFNQANELGALAGLNQFNMAKYGEDMKGFAAGKQASAMGGGKK